MPSQRSEASIQAKREAQERGDIFFADRELLC